MTKYGFVYILTNKSGSTLYIGVTSDIVTRLRQHRTGEGGSRFAKRYRMNRLIHFEAFPDIRQAIAREKQLKGWKRCRKDELIRAANPELADLSEEASRVFTELWLGSGIVR